MPILGGCIGFARFDFLRFYTSSYSPQILRAERACRRGRFEWFWPIVRALEEKYGQKRLFRFL